ncbi:ABC transporter substrate-binding protein [Georgenia yuyongxinii]|uniref:Thiamine pyrimidine synthase n=1 Tax=Georgenia yuyongxinii TaxID=2589797 RepID=A0A5B8C926_9MICO|nr:ABC transporter substrate-binding protein [Georgenia yuyongxinii]QDC25662.1 ABC transporter substrate-binding protein [Georgenia yuyongxinii]
MSQRLTRHRRRTTSVLALAAATTLMAACGGSSASAPSEQETTEGTADFGDISVQLSWVKTVEFAGEYFADTKGYFAEEGFDEVTLIPGPAATPSIVASGQAFAGISDPTRVAPAVANEGAPVKIVAAQYQKSPFSIISLADKANITTPQDLVGKRIGIQTGNEPLFYSLLEANGLDRDSVTIVPVEYDPSSLITGDVDGFLGYVTNEAVIVESQGYEVANLLYADNGLPLVAKAVVVSQDSIDNEREAVKAFLRAMIRGWHDAIADSEESARLAVEEYGADLGLNFDLELGQAVAANDLLVSADTDSNGLFTITPELLQANIDVIGAADVDITADQLFDLSLLEEVYEENPELLG